MSTSTASPSPSPASLTGQDPGLEALTLAAEPISAVAAPQRRHGLIAQMLRFTGVGASMTLSYVLLFVLLKPLLGSQTANAIAQVLTAVGNTALNRKFTFQVHGPQGLLRQHAQGLLVLCANWGLTALVLFIVHQAVEPDVTAEVFMLMGANLVVTVLRFTYFRHWVFRPGTPGKI